MNTPSVRIANDALLRRMFDSTTDRCWCIDEEFRLLEINSSSELFIKNILGATPVIGMNILELFSDEGSILYWKDLYLRALRGENLRTRQFHLQEGKTVESELQLHPVTDAHGRIIAVSCISRDLENDAAFRKREQVRNILFKATLQNSRDSICAFDNEGRYIAFNSRHARMVARFYGVTLQTGMRPDEYLSGKNEFEQLKRDRKRALSGEFFTDVLPFETGPGQLGFLELFHAPLVNEMGQVAGYSIVFRDVTEKHRRELQMKRLTLSELRERKLREAELHRITEERVRQKEEVLLATVRSLENERTRIASDLHDDLGPGLSKISSVLQLLLLNDELDADLREALIKTLGVSNEAQQSISEIIWSMDPRHNGLKEFVAYLRHYATEYLEGSAIRFKVNTPRNVPDGRVDGKTRRNLFLIVKEALGNILKHSSATEASLEVWIEETASETGAHDSEGDRPKPPIGLHLVITDNGTGFDEQQLRPFRNGLTNMKVRAAAAGGTLSIRSLKGEGTTLDLKAEISQAL